MSMPPMPPEEPDDLDDPDPTLDQPVRAQEQADEEKGQTEPHGPE